MSRAMDLASNAAALDALADIQPMLTARGVGVVSQVGGVPTGAIVESGSNGNATFTKFADGTAIIRMTGVERGTQVLQLSAMAAGIKRGPSWN